MKPHAYDEPTRNWSCTYGNDTTSHSYTSSCCYNPLKSKQWLLFTHYKAAEIVLLLNQSGCQFVKNNIYNYGSLTVNNQLELQQLID